MKPMPVKNTFINTLDCQPIPNSVLWVVQYEFRYADYKGDVYVIPVGFTTDFASIPPLARFGAIVALLAQFAARWLTWFYPLEFFALWVCFVAEWMENSGTDEIATVHDFLYATACVARWKADMILFTGMIGANATRNPLWKRILFLVNVRLFGWIPWMNHRRQDRKKRR